MKKIISAAIIAAATLSSCTQEQPQTPKVRNFSYEMQGNSIYTKAVNGTDVLGAIEATLPESLDIILTSNSTSKVFSGKTGQGIILPSDTYSVIAGLNGTPSSEEIVKGRLAYLASTPKISVSQELTITDDVTDYSLIGKYESFVLVVDSEEVESATVTTTKGSEQVKWITSGESMLTFAQGDFSSVYLQITIVPTDKERYKDTTFTLSTKSQSGIGYVQNGMYYVLHPTANGAQPKVIGLELPDFIEGTL